jgi:hypothetical protein
VSAPITPVSPISALITIQPVATTVTGRDAAGTQNLLALLSDGSFVRGFVVNRDAQNNPIIRTPQGDFVVKSDVFIKTGSEIVFQVDATKASLARIVTIDNLTPEDYSTQTVRPSLLDSIAASPFKNVGQPTQSATSPLTTPPILKAVLLQTLGTSPSTAVPGPGPVLPATLTQLSAGTPLALTVLDIELPPIAVSVASVPQSANLTNLLSSAKPAPALSASPISAPPLPVLPASLPSALAASFLAAQSSPNYTTTPPVLTSRQLTDHTAQTVIATVIGHGEDGSAIVHTPYATLKVYSTQPLPTGTNLTLRIDVPPADTTETANPFQTIRQQASTTTFSEFKYLAPALEKLGISDPAMARELLQQLPVIGPKFTSGLLFFLSAVKTGERRGLFSQQEIARLEGIAPGMLSQLNKDVRELHQAFLNPPLDNWKVIALPLVFGSAVETAKLYIRGEPDESTSKIEASAKGQRFLLDMHLSQLGDMQLDGFVREANSNKSLELFLRAAEPLEPAFTDHVRNLFINGLETTGMKGNIVFQQGSEHFVKPTPKMPAHPAGGESAHTILA